MVELVLAVQVRGLGSECFDRDPFTRVGVPGVRLRCTHRERDKHGVLRESECVRVAAFIWRSFIGLWGHGRGWLRVFCPRSSHSRRRAAHTTTIRATRARSAWRASRRSPLACVCYSVVSSPSHVFGDLREGCQWNEYETPKLVSIFSGKK